MIIGIELSIFLMTYRTYSTLNTCCLSSCMYVLFKVTFNSESKTVIINTFYFNIYIRINTYIFSRCKRRI